MQPSAPVTLGTLLRTALGQKPCDGCADREKGKEPNPDQSKVQNSPC